MSMISHGFGDLADLNPELAYKTIIDILVGINEYACLLLKFHILILHHVVGIPQ